MEYFVIILDQGEYSDRTMTNLFLVETQELAESLVDSLKKASEYVAQFRKNELHMWNTLYDLQRPQPSQPSHPARKTGPLPKPPEHLRSLSKKEKRANDYYQAFIKELRLWEDVNMQELDEIRRIDDAYFVLSNQWYKDKRDAEKLYLAEQLEPNLKSFFPDAYCEKLTPYVSSDEYSTEFSYDRLEVL